MRDRWTILRDHFRSPKHIKKILREDLLFCSSLDFGGKLDICERDDLIFALPIRMALGFKEPVLLWCSGKMVTLVLEEPSFFQSLEVMVKYQIIVQIQMLKIKQTREIFNFAVIEAWQRWRY